MGQLQQEEEERYQRVKERYERVGQGHIFEILPKIDLKSKLFQQVTIAPFGGTNFHTSFL